MRLEEVRVGMRVRIVCGPCVSDDSAQNVGTVAYVADGSEFGLNGLVIIKGADGWETLVEPGEIEPEEAP